MGSKGPPGHTATPVNRVVKEVKRNWWLWGAVCFAVVLIISVVMFRHKLFNTGDIGLPFLAGTASAVKVKNVTYTNAARASQAPVSGCYFLNRQLNNCRWPAVKENAAETCAAKCRASSSDFSRSADTDVRNKQEFDACYSKCV